MNGMAITGQLAPAAWGIDATAQLAPVAWGMIAVLCISAAALLVASLPEGLTRRLGVRLRARVPAWLRTRREAAGATASCAVTVALLAMASATIGAASAGAAEGYLNCTRIADTHRFRPRPTVELTSRFGHEDCTISKGAFLCAPSAKDDPEAQPGGSGDDLLCYRARCTGGSVPDAVGAQGDFDAPGRDVKVRTSRMVCAPFVEIPLSCGNGTADEGEQCDPTAYSPACPGECLEDCTCPDVLCNGLMPTITGTPRADRLSGTPGDDVISALGGNDQVFGMGGNDIICGGKGRDILYGGLGADTLIGGPGEDILLGGDDGDVLEGEDGADTLDGGRGADTLMGGSGTDVLIGGTEDDAGTGPGSSSGETVSAGATYNLDACDGGGGTDTCVTCYGAEVSCENVRP